MVAALVIVVLALAAAALGAVVLHNRLAAARNGVAEGWSQVEVQLARRFATVDDLAAITRAYAQF
ncbi:MAG: LemA family protein, partial [Acidimicrobiales bacterium]